MKKITWILIALFAIFLATALIQSGIKPAVKSDSLDKLSLPEGFKIDVFAGNLGGSQISYPGTNPGARMMLLKDDVLFVTITREGRVVALPDKNGDKKADEAITFIGTVLK